MQRSGYIALHHYYNKYQETNIGHTEEFIRVLHINRSFWNIFFKGALGSLCFT